MALFLCYLLLHWRHFIASIVQQEPDSAHLMILGSLMVLETGLVKPLRALPSKT